MEDGNLGRRLSRHDLGSNFQDNYSNESKLSSGDSKEENQGEDMDDSGKEADNNGNLPIFEEIFTEGGEGGSRKSLKAGVE
jgi:hypothetical protein